MKFPILVYHCPGNHQCLSGTFDYIQVSNAEQLKASIKNGWYPSLPQAMKGGDVDLEALIEEPVVAKVKEPELVISYKPPTREELETKAKELGIGFNKNTKDETLLEKIEAALGEE